MLDDMAEIEVCGRIGAKCGLWPHESGAIWNKLEETGTTTLGYQTPLGPGKLVIEREQ